MHMVSRKDHNSADLEIVLVSQSEVQTQEEATVYVRELDLVVTVKLLARTGEEIQGNL